MTNAEREQRSHRATERLIASQEVDHVPEEAHDRRVQEGVTEHGRRSFDGSATSPGRHSSHSDSSLRVELVSVGVGIGPVLLQGLSKTRAIRRRLRGNERSDGEVAIDAAGLVGPGFRFLDHLARGQAAKQSRHGFQE